jgi:AraC-like DNA-binding protein
MPPAFTDMIAAMWSLRTRHVTGGPPPVLEVCLPRSPPSDLGEHRRLLGGPFRWEGPSVRFTFDAALLDVPMRGADQTLGVVLDRHLEEQAAQLPAGDDLLTSIRGALAEDLADGAPDLDHVARRLAMSRRTLQRALRREGTSFQRLVDDTRREVALARLRDPRLTLSELAFLVGFSELSAFDRAFRRWTGQSPRAYRSASQAA